MTYRAFAFLLSLLLPGLGVAATQETATLTNGTGQAYSFALEVVTTPAEQAQGLMFRERMDDDAGMLFLYTEDKVLRMWMKNTILPLDMLFIAKDGRIAGVVANTTPQSLAEIASPGPVRAVLELKAGTAARLGLKAGDRFASPSLPAD